MQHSTLLERHTVGLVLRVYATKEADVANRVQYAQEAIDRAGAIMVNGRPVFKRFDVLVWADKRYPESDCGKTASALREAFRGNTRLFVSEVQHGDLFCGVLSYGVAKQLRHGIDYSVILSGEAFSYMTPETFGDMLAAAENGALAIGVAINELTDSILAGRIANTFGMWKNEMLLTAGGFDLKAEKPTDPEIADCVEGWSAIKDATVRYHLAGVEEMIPLARMVRMFGPCIAPILPSGEGVQRYVVPDPATSLELWERHFAKMGTKFERQCQMLAAAKADPSYLQGGVMPAYRKVNQEVARG